MSLDQKYRVREVAKDFVLKGKPVGSKKVMELLGKYATTPSSTSAALTDGELSLVFEALTQSNPATLADVFAETYQEKKPEPKAAPAKKAEQAEQPKQSEQPKQADKPQQQVQADGDGPVPPAEQQQRREDGKGLHREGHGERYGDPRAQREQHR